MGYLNRLLKKATYSHSTPEQSQCTASQGELLQSSLQENIQYITNKLGNSSDIVFREIQIGTVNQIQAAILYTDGLTDTKSVQDFILDSLMAPISANQLEQMISSQDQAFHILKNQILIAGEVKDVTEFDSLFTSLLSGDVILLLDGYAQGITIGMRGWKDRGVAESTTETVIRGPKEGFSESLRTNTSLIRRKIKNPNLWLETKQIGKVTKTDVGIMYINGIVNNKIVEEVHTRLDRIDIDGILESGYIEELIQDETYTPFPTIYHSERPDVIAAELLEGKVAILVDGTPIVLIVPALLISFVHAAEDYYQRSDISTLIRMLRFLSIVITLLAPSLYIAITTFHQEMLPSDLLISLAAQREGVPIPAFIEALGMEVTFEILREAGLRMPKAVAQAVSIVGTLVIGTAAVEAGIISAAMVVVVSITAICSFVLPAFDMSMSLRILRFPIMALAASFGFFGIIIAIIMITLHLCSLRTFGIPYLSPFAPFNLEEHKDTIFRLPRWTMSTRPWLGTQHNRIRGRNNPPEPPRNNTGG
ncbi:spore germination protein [Paenibacillus albiflavus]|uniref:Spore germination protein n=1 Tax=Paenibacillus albiflavus TaxID=2545760 RepID=A0A4V2WN35_9BACL|nr:spore germination protein [Paenibacillus albiflavus]TCZ74012.1 spore germination protein [Paenibacillus albiflavus]